ncbi:DUF2007 domain-containing protein [bacterium]|nr:DUF2007 domain-containing protein [bacterium]
MAEFVIVRTFDDPLKAHVLKTKLESEGIECFLHDDILMTLMPLYNIAVGGVKLKINANDLSYATEILAKFENTKLTNSEDEVIQCSNCGSDEFFSGYKWMRNTMGFFSFILTFLLMIYPIYAKHVYKCKACGKEFETM